MVVSTLRSAHLPAAAAGGGAGSRWHRPPVLPQSRCATLQCVSRMTSAAGALLTCGLITILTTPLSAPRVWGWRRSSFPRRSRWVLGCTPAEPGARMYPSGTACPPSGGQRTAVTCRRDTVWHFRQRRHGAGHCY